jgi:hypothetical protein
MATLIELAQAIETEYSKPGDNILVKVCRPQMSQPIGAGNLPYFRETGSVTEETSSGLLQGYMIVKAQTNEGEDFAILNAGAVADIDTDAYSLTEPGRKALEDYRSFYRPFGTEFDSLWAAIITHFTSVRNLRFIKRIDYINGTPVYGHVNGLRLVGDGVTGTEAFNEFWAYEATYGAGWTIKSWKS